MKCNVTNVFFGWHMFIIIACWDERKQSYANNDDDYKEGKEKVEAME